MSGNEGGWFGLDDLFWLTLLVLFFSALAGSLVRRLQKNRCLKYFHNHHVTYISATGKPLWGDLHVSSQGVELLYDSPFTNSRGLVKGSHLVPVDEIGESIALVRTIHALTDDERRERVRQIEKTFAPGLVRRSSRRLRNFVDMMRDAIANSLSMFVGALSGRVGTAIASRKADVNELGKTLVGSIAYAYEPLLERHIGKPVVVECSTAPDAASPKTEFAGYLVEYTKDYLAVFDVEQTPVKYFDLALDGPSVGDGYEVDFVASRSQELDRMLIKCPGPDALIIRDITTESGKMDLDVTLFPGCVFGVIVGSERPVNINLERTYQLDLVCPRKHAHVRFGSDANASKEGWQGVAPQAEDDAA